MQITVEKTEKVYISDKEQKKITQKYLENRYKINRYMWIKDGDLMHEVEYHTSHSWHDDEVVRSATEQDKMALAMIKDLYTKDNHGNI